MTEGNVFTLPISGGGGYPIQPDRVPPSHYGGVGGTPFSLTGEYPIQADGRYPNLRMHYYLLVMEPLQGKQIGWNK